MRMHRPSLPEHAATPADPAPAPGTDIATLGAERFPLPSGLDEDTARVLRALVKESMTKNTRDAMAGAVRYWDAWHQARYGVALPLPAAPLPLATVMTYLGDHAVLEPVKGRAAFSMPKHVEQALLACGAKRRQGPPRFATWSQRLAMISTAHALLGLPNACRDPVVRDLVRRAKHPAQSHRLLPKRHPPALREAVEAMLKTCDDSPAGIRDKAMLLFAFASGGRRRSEVAGAAFEQLTARVDDQGYRYFLYHLTDAKRQQVGEERPKPVRGRAAKAMEAWMALLEAQGQILQGPVFRPVRGKRRVWIGDSLSGHAVNAILKDRAAKAKLDPELTAHSLRGGFLTQAHRDGFDILDAMALSDHRDFKTVKEHYLKEIEVERNPTGSIMG